MRLIDADALMARFQREQETMYEHGREYSFSFLNSGQEISTEWYAVERFLEEAPTIDAVPVVRCKDCRWGREVCGNIECFADINVPTEYHGYEWYCPNGERKDNE